MKLPKRVDNALAKVAFVQKESATNCDGQGNIFEVETLAYGDDGQGKLIGGVVYDLLCKVIACTRGWGGLKLNTASPPGPTSFHVVLT